jgi:hypothetical protein
MRRNAHAREKSQLSQGSAAVANKGGNTEMALGVRWVVVGEREPGLDPFTRSSCHYSGGDKPKNIQEF